MGAGGWEVVATTTRDDATCRAIQNVMVRANFRPLVPWGCVAGGASHGTGPHRWQSTWFLCCRWWTGPACAAAAPPRAPARAGGSQEARVHAGWSGVNGWRVRESSSCCFSTSSFQARAERGRVGEGTKGGTRADRLEVTLLRLEAQSARGQAALAACTAAATARQAPQRTPCPVAAAAAASAQCSEREGHTT